MDMNNVQNTTDKVINDAAATTQEVADKTLTAAGAAMDNASDRLGAARARATEAIDHLAGRAQQHARVGIDKASDARDYAKRSLQNAGDATSSYVEEQPLKSIAIAAGVGAATAALLMMLRGRDR